MALVTESLSHFESLAIGVWVSTGTRHETEEEAGLSHFLEHMMFKGTEKRSALDIALAVDRVGGEFNAFTAREHTCFHILTLYEDLKMGIEILSDVLLGSQFDEAEIDRERKVILQEIAMVEDTPEEYLYDLFYEQAYGKHPLGKPILGTKESVGGFKRSDLVSFFRKHYSPKNMLISVAGNVTHKEVETLLERHLAKHLKAKDAPKKPNLKRPKIHSSSICLKKNIEQAQIIVGFPGLDQSSKDRYAFHLLNTYLGGGMSSALFQEIREKRGLAYSVYSALSTFTDSGLISVYIGTANEEVRTCLEITGKEISKLRNKPIDAKYLEMLKDNLKGTIRLSSDSSEHRMMANARAEMQWGRGFSLKEVCTGIDKVTSAKLQELSHKYFDPKRAILTLMSDRKHSGLDKLLQKSLK